MIILIYFREIATKFIIKLKILRVFKVKNVKLEP